MRKDPREAFNDLVRKRQETPVPRDVEERLRAKLHAFRDDLDMRDAHPLLPRRPRFGRRADSAPVWKTLLTAAVVVAAALAVALMLRGM